MVKEVTTTIGEKAIVQTGNNILKQTAQHKPPQKK